MNLFAKEKKKVAVRLSMFACVNSVGVRSALAGSIVACLLARIMCTVEVVGYLCARAHVRTVRTTEGRVYGLVRFPGRHVTRYIKYIVTCSGGVSPGSFVCSSAVPRGRRTLRGQSLSTAQRATTQRLRICRLFQGTDELRTPS